MKLRNAYWVLNSNESVFIWAIMASSLNIKIFISIGALLVPISSSGGLSITSREHRIDLSVFSEFSYLFSCNPFCLSVLKL